MMDDLTAADARSQRNTLVQRTEVLDKVAVLRTLPDDMHVTTEMVAEFYSVTKETIRQLVNRNREELDDDGYAVVGRRAFEESYGLSLPSSASTFALFPRRAVLRVGMLLRDSEVAKRVRDYLLNLEERDFDREPFTVPPDYASALEEAARQVRRAEIAEARVAELEPKAEIAEHFLAAPKGTYEIKLLAKSEGMKEKDVRKFFLEEGIWFVRAAPCGRRQYIFKAEYKKYFWMGFKYIHEVNGEPCYHSWVRIWACGIGWAHTRIAKATK